MDRAATQPTYIQAATFSLLFLKKTTNSTSQRTIRLCLAASTIMSTYQAPFRLLDLPPELLGEVCGHLPDRQLKHIRLMCKALQTHSMTAFGKRFFDHLIVLLHPTSLAIFLDIAAHKELSKHVKQVSLSGERIGQSIDLEEDEQKHIKLQQGLEKSGFDSAILMEAFPMLGNLRTVRIDIEQFQLCDNSHNRLGLRCGSKHLKPMSAYSGGRGEDQGYNRIYSLVLGVLEKTCLPRINLEMAFWATPYQDGDGENNVRPYFDVQSPLWKDENAKRTRSLSFIGTVDVTWVGDLLQSAKDVCSVSVIRPAYCTDTGFRIPYYSCTNSKWPKLTRLRLGNMETSHSGFLGLLKVHLNSLEEISIFAVGFVEGTWLCALTTLSRMPKLRALKLSDLFEREAYSHPNFSDYMSDFEEVVFLETMGVRKVTRTTKALCEGLATVSREKSTVEGEGRRSYAHLVNLRRGYAASLRSDN